MCNVLPNKVTYTGASVVHENQPWSIKCSNLKSDDLIRWTRNGQSLEPELASGQLVVQSPVGSGSSTLQAMHATDSHEGDYKCTQDSDESFHLWIYYGSYIDFPWQISLLLLFAYIQATGISVRMSANFSVHCYSHPVLETEVTERCHVKSLLHVVLFASSISNPLILVIFFLLIFLDIFTYMTYKRSNIVSDSERLNVVNTVVCLLIRLFAWSCCIYVVIIYFYVFWRNVIDVCMIIFKEFKMLYVKFYGYQKCNEKLKIREI